MAGKKTDRETRTERLGIRVTPALKAAIERCAERERRTSSQWIELAIEAAVLASDAAAKKR